MTDNSPSPFCALQHPRIDSVEVGKETKVYRQMLEGLHITLPGRHTATPPFPPSPSLRASSYKSSDGSIAPLRRTSSNISIIPETDSALDHSLKGELFKVAVLKMLIKLKLTSWKLNEAEYLVVKNIASALTNSVYLIILDSQKLLLRIYGPNVLHLIDRDYETSVLARLAHHKIGPRLLGQFKNGRVEQWLESVEVTSEEIRRPQVSLYIARRMREFHDFVTLLPPEMDKISAGVNLDSWIPSIPEARMTPTIRTFLEHIARYRAHLASLSERTKDVSEVVFCHNDLQYGNLLRVGGEEHNCLAVIDFEYAGPNPRAFDIANHFIEWMADYHTEPSFALDPAAYPTAEESAAFLHEYLMYGKVIARREEPVVSTDEVNRLAEQVDLLRAISHAQWAIWGIIQALPPPPVTTKKTRRGTMRSPFLRSTTTTMSMMTTGGSGKLKKEADTIDDFSIGEAYLSTPALVRASTLPVGKTSSTTAAGAATDPDSDGEWDDGDDDDGEGGFDYVAYADGRIGLFYGECLRMGLVSREEVPADVRVVPLPAAASVVAM